MDLIDIADNFFKEKDTKFFQFLLNGSSWGATKKRSCRCSISIPKDIANTENKNLGEVHNYFGIVMFIKKDKVKEFIKTEVKKQNEIDKNT